MPSSCAWRDAVVLSCGWRVIGAWRYAGFSCEWHVVGTWRIAVVSHARRVVGVWSEAAALGFVVPWGRPYVDVLKCYQKCGICYN